MRGTEFAELAAFLAVVRERSFRRAASRLSLSPSALSHTIRALEDRLGVRLLNRTTRSVAPTEPGQALFDRIAPAFTEISGAVDVVRASHGRPSGTVKLNCPKLAADLVLAPMLGLFARRYPDIRLEVRVDDDLSDIVAEGFDAGIRPGERVQRDMVAVRLTPALRTVVVGSPDYLAAHPAPRHPRDLREHACINYRWPRSGALYRWPLAKRGRSLEVEVQGLLTVNNVDLLLDAALAGAGLICTLEQHAAEHLAGGRLVRVLEDWCRPFPGFFLYYPSRRQIPPALRCLVDFLQAPRP
jgi:DNA-binding transcriptional LysR family regulator